MAFTNRVEHKAQCVRESAVMSPARTVVLSLPGIDIVALAVGSSKLVQFTVTYNFNVARAASRRMTAAYFGHFPCEPGGREEEMNSD